MQVKGNGSFLMYAGREPQDITIDDSSMPYEFDEERGSLTVQLGGGDKLTREVVVQF